MEARDATATGELGRMDPARPLVAARPRYGEKIIQGLLAACALISVITTTVIVISLLSPTLDFFGEVGIGNFFSLDEWAPTQAEPTFGALRLVIGTLSATLWALVFAVPIGLLSAIPERIRPSARSQDREADPRGPCRDPHRGAGPVRDHLHQPGDPGPLPERRQVTAVLRP